METQIIPVSPGIFEVIGDLTFTTVNQLQKLPKEILSSKTKSKIMLNKVHHIDSAGLALLIDWERQTTNNNPIVFSRPNRQLLRLVELYSLQNVLQLETAKNPVDNLVS